MLKNRENLDDNKNEYDRLEAALSVNKPLATVYYLKEALQMLWSQDVAESCKKMIVSWVEEAFASGIKALIRFAKTLIRHSYGILNWYKYKISSGPLEGLNGNSNKNLPVIPRKPYH